MQYCTKKDLKFMLRLKKNRLVCDITTGELNHVEDLPLGRHEVYVKTSGTTKFDRETRYLIIKHQDPKTNKVITILCSQNLQNYQDQQLVEKYLDRWGVEDHFRRIKQLFNLEKNKVRKWQRRQNLLALILWAYHLNHKIQQKIQQWQADAHLLSVGILAQLEQFLKQKNKTQNPYSLNQFIRQYLPPSLQFHLRVKSPPISSSITLPLFYPSKNGG